MSLKIADNLTLPLDFMTERIAFLARTGSGKSGGMRVLFEQIMLAQQFGIFIDPKGDAWGIRADGTGKGLPVLVIGGDHGDIPLEAHGGKVIAEFLVKERVSTVLDISDLSTNDMWRFVADLTKTLYKLNRDVLHLFIDEADMLAGQQFYDPHCLHGIQLIQNKGRARGFGVTIATQRPQILNKTVLNASGTLIAMQTIGDDALKVVKSWLGQSADKETIAAILKDLPTMKTREAFVYSPQTLGIEPKRIKFASFTTYDSMRTPRPGEARQQPKNIADIDLTAIQRDMAETIEKAKSEDPALLKAEIARLKREAAGHVCPTVAAEPVEIEKLVVDDAAIDAFGATAHRRLVDLRAELLGKIDDAERDLIDAVRGLRSEPAEDTLYIPTGPTKPFAVDVVAEMMQAPDRPQRNARITGLSTAGLGEASDAALNEGERRILTCIAQDGRGVTTENIAVLTGYKATSRRVYLNNLTRKGFAEKQGAAFYPTQAGIAALGEFEPLPTGPALREYWLEKLGEGEAKIFRVICEIFPASVSKEYLAEKTGYKATSIRVYSNNLVVRKLATKEHGQLKAANDLF